MCSHHVLQKCCNIYDVKKPSRLKMGALVSEQPQQGYHQRWAGSDACPASAATPPVGTHPEAQARLTEVLRRGCRKGPEGARARGEAQLLSLCVGSGLLFFFFSVISVRNHHFHQRLMRTLAQLVSRGVFSTASSVPSPSLNC